MTASSSVACQLATFVPSNPASTAPSQNVSAILGQWEKQIKIVSAYYTSRFKLCEADCFDLEQACRIALWQAVAHRSLSPDTYEKYLRRVLRNTIHTTLKSLVPDPGRRTFVDELGDDDEAGERDCHALVVPTTDTPHELVIDINHCLSQLEPGLRRLCELVYYQGFSQKEAAFALGVSQPRVCQLHELLIQHVKQELHEYRM
jgi:RNA polymerase sigma factor (sigma-70 family)